MRTATSFMVQTVVVQYRVEWWENFALPADPQVLSTYEPSWEDSSILDDLFEEYVGVCGTSTSN